MNQITHIYRSLATLALGIALASLPAGAQSLLSTEGVVILSDGDPVPDRSGVPIPGFAFALISSPAVDSTGRILFRGGFTGPGVTWENLLAYFHRAANGHIRMLTRAGDQAPGLPSGVVLRGATSADNGWGLGQYPVLTPSGLICWSSRLFDTTGTNNITANNDWAFFGGRLDGPQTLIVQKGDPLPAPAPSGTTWASLMPAPVEFGMNGNGAIYFGGQTTGGDTSTALGSNNEAGLWAGLPSALEQIGRRTYPVSGLPGKLISGSVAPGLALGGNWFNGDTIWAVGYPTQINSNNEVFYDVYLSLSLGSPPATIANDKAYMVHKLGVGGTLLLREGDVAPNTNGATFNAINQQLDVEWEAGISKHSWTRSGKTVFQSTLRGGDVSGTSNDSAIFVGGVGSLSLAVRKGENAPGTDGAFSVFAPFPVMNDAGYICFVATIQGGTTGPSNNVGMWAGLPDSLQLVARKGDVMPDGTLLDTFAPQSWQINDTNRVLFNTFPPGPGGQQQIILGTWQWTWSPISGLKGVSFYQDQIEVQPGVFKTVYGVGTNPMNNGDCSPRGWSHNGYSVWGLSFTDGTHALMTLFLGPENPTAEFCVGDGTGAACPCGNTGAPGRGCASSAYAGGASLSAAGYAGTSSGSDSLVLKATDISGPGLFLQSNALLTAAPIPFGDGLLCAAVGITRLGVVFPTGGLASYPGGLTPNPIHIAGGPITAGVTKHYQCWYRSVPGVCGPQNYNLTPGRSITWGP